MIGVDWGTSSFRAYLLGADGAVRARRESPMGLLRVPPGGFESVLREAVGDWIAGGERRVLLAGMVGSRQGWREAPYLPCPAGASELAAALTPLPYAGAEVRLVPGVSGEDAAGVPEVMRGEETQIVGALGEGAGSALFCLPGSHSKWVRAEGGRIAGFATHLTGEAYAALRGHTILGRMMAEGAAEDEAAFAAGVARAAEGGGLLHHLFGVRTLGLMGRLPESGAASYLSGLLIGHEVRAALPPGGARVRLIGAAGLCARYARAIALAGGESVTEAEDAAARGLAEIGRRARWTD